MLTLKIPQNIYQGAGWAIAAIDDDDNVISVTMIDGWEDETGSDAACDLYENLEGCDIVRGGMCGSGEFSYNFTKRERKSLGCKNVWY